MRALPGRRRPASGWSRRCARRRGNSRTRVFVALGTRPADPEHWFAKMLAGGADYAQMHAARDHDPKFQARTWRKANPSMRHFPDLEIAIRTEARQAKRDPRRCWPRSMHCG